MRLSSTAAPRIWRSRPNAFSIVATPTPAAISCATHARTADGGDHQWTILGASRGERGVLGEGIRQALLRDPTYAPALAAARAMLA